MKGLTFNLSAIINIFIPISFYCCLSGTILTLITFAFSFKYTILSNPVKKLALIFALLWLLNIFANFYVLFTTLKPSNPSTTTTTSLNIYDSKNNKSTLYHL